MDNKRPKKPQHESKNTTSNLFESIAAAVAAAPPPPLHATQSEPDIGARVSGKKRVSFGRNITVFHSAHTATAAAASSSTSYARMPSPVPTPLPPDFFNETRTLFDHIRLHENTGEGVGQGQAMMTFTFDDNNQQRAPPPPGSPMPMPLDRSDSTTISFGTRLQGTPTGQFGSPSAHDSPMPLDRSESDSVGDGSPLQSSPTVQLELGTTTARDSPMHESSDSTGIRSYLQGTHVVRHGTPTGQIELGTSTAQGSPTPMLLDPTTNTVTTAIEDIGSRPMLLELSESASIDIGGGGTQLHSPATPTPMAFVTTPTNLLQLEAANRVSNTGDRSHLYYTPHGQQRLLFDQVQLQQSFEQEQEVEGDVTLNEDLLGGPAHGTPAMLLDLSASTCPSRQHVPATPTNLLKAKEAADLEANTGIGSDGLPSSSTTPTPAQDDPFAKFKVAAMFSKPIMELSDEEFAQQWEAGMEQLEAELVPAVQNYNEQKARYLEGQRRQLAIYEELQRRIRALDEEQEQWEAEFNALVNGEDEDDEEDGEEVDDEGEENVDEAAI